MKAIYKFQFDCGRMGNLSGLFIAEKDAVKDLIESGKEVYFGEVLGRHSEIAGPVEASDVEMLSDEPDDVKLFEKLKATVGINPFDYIDENEDEEDSSDEDEAATA